MISGKFLFKDKDKGFKRLRAEFRKAKVRAVKVGIITGKAEEAHAGTSLSNAQIGAIHEFGIGNVPSRSFIRAYFDAHKNEILGNLGAIAKRVMTRPKHGIAQPISFFLGRLGLKAVGGIQTLIANRIPPKLADETIKRKGSDVPLIDKGQLRSSITYALTNKSGKVLP